MRPIALILLFTVLTNASTFEVRVPIKSADICSVVMLGRGAVVDASSPSRVLRWGTDNDKIVEHFFVEAMPGNKGTNQDGNSSIQKIMIEAGVDTAGYHSRGIQFVTTEYRYKSLRTGPDLIAWAGSNVDGKVIIGITLRYFDDAVVKQLIPVAQAEFQSGGSSFSDARWASTGEGHIKDFSLVLTVGDSPHTAFTSVAPILKALSNKIDQLIRDEQFWR